jgi:Sap, sulfolipid-1-addressing protein
VREALPYAAGVAVSPIPIAAILLLLTGRGATANGLSFLGGWVVGVAVPTVLFVALIDRADVTDSDPLWITVAELALGAAFLLAAAVVWARRHRHAERDLPWVENVDRFTTARSAGLGVVLSGANPKVVALSLGAALALAQANADGASIAGGVALFTVVGTLGVVAPLALYVVAPARAGAVLVRGRAWLARHEVGAAAALGVLVGTVFLLDAAGGL